MNKLNEEKEMLIMRMRQQESDHQAVVTQLQQHVQLKEQALAAEMNEMDRSFKEQEHILMEQIEEKTRMAQVQ